MNDEYPLDAAAAADDGATALVDVVHFKWLLSGEGIHLHVERMLSDPGYAAQVLDRAQHSSSAVLRDAAQRLSTRLPKR